MMPPVVAFLLLALILHPCPADAYYGAQRHRGSGGPLAGSRESGQLHLLPRADAAWGTCGLMYAGFDLVDRSWIGFGTWDAAAAVPSFCPSSSRLPCFNRADWGGWVASGVPD